MNYMIFILKLRKIDQYWGLIINSRTLNIVLASSSRYRKELLDRLNIEFTVSIPEINEQHLQGESIEAYVERLSELKAEYTAHNKKDSLVISDKLVASKVSGIK